MSKQFIKRQKGFTIIEVMIVLAVAALILLAVFLAIPNLQRSSRNSGRKADAGRVGTAATSFTANNNGTLPASTTDAGTVLTDAGTLSQFSLTGTGGVACSTLAKVATTKLTVCTGALSVTGNASGDDGMVLSTSAQCGTTGTTATTIGGTARQMALVYTVETSGAPTYSCINL